METASELVARGAALLDEKLPGWADQIDLHSLAMDDACKCVLGQIGDRQYNLDRLGWDYDGSDGEFTPGYEDLADAMKIDGYEYGFCTTDLQWNNHSQLTWEALQDSWKGEIVARRTLEAL